MSDITQFGIVGTGAAPATFVPADGNCRAEGRPWLFFDHLTDLRLENVTLDVRGATMGGPMHLFLEGESSIKDVTYLGSCSSQLGTIRVQVEDESGVAGFENVVATNVNENETLTGIFVGEDHAGELTFRDCTLEQFSDNGLYASAPGGDNGSDGAVRVVGGTYKNNNVAGVRLGSSGSSAENVTVVVDAETPGSGGLNARGIRLRNKSGQVIDGCDVTFEANAADSFGGIVFHQANGGALVKESSLSIERDSIPAIRAFPVEQSTNSAPIFENCTITGEAASGVTARIEGRDGTVFEKCTIEQHGNDRRGLHFLDSADCRVVDSRLDVSTVPIAVENGSVTLENTTIVTDDGDRYFGDRTLESETAGSVETIVR